MLLKYIVFQRCLEIFIFMDKISSSETIYFYHKGRRLRQTNRDHVARLPNASR